jgi:hypothetical protein
MAEEIAFFKEAGYKIGIYKAVRVIKGNKQAVALANSLELVDTMEF